MKLKNLAAITSGLLLLAACSGGGGSDSPAPVTSAPGVTTVDNANAVDVSASAVSAADSTISAGDTVTVTSVPAGVEVQPKLSRSAVKVVREQVLVAAALVAEPAQVPVGIELSKVVTCASGGTVTVKITRANSGNLSKTFVTGDKIDLTANDCKNSKGTITGSIAITMKEVTGTIGVLPYSFTATTNLTAVKVVTNATSYIQFDGDLTVTDNKTTSSVKEEVVTATSLRASGQGGAGKTFATEISNASTRVILATSSDTATISFNQTFKTTLPSGKVYGPMKVETLQDVVVSNYSSSADVTVSGIVLITGSNGSKLKLTANNNNNFTIEVDATGDGTYEYSTPTTRPALDDLSGS